MSVTIKLRGNTESYWQSANPVPADREVILSTDKGNFKVGNGSDDWASLGYWLPEDLASVIKIVGGNVGLNMPNPSSRLSIGPVETDDPIRLLVRDTGFTKHGFGIVPGTFRMFTSSNASIVFGQISVLDGQTFSQSARLDESKNFSVGSHLPTTRLDIASGAIEIEEMTPPAAPAANNIRLYAKDNGSGKTQLCVKFSDGTETILATQP